MGALCHSGELPFRLNARASENLPWFHTFLLEDVIALPALWGGEACWEKESWLTPSKVPSVCSWQRQRSEWHPRQCRPTRLLINRHTWSNLSQQSHVLIISFLPFPVCSFISHGDHEANNNLLILASRVPLNNVWSPFSSKIQHTSP